MYNDDARQLRAGLDLLDEETRYYALMHIEEYVPRGTRLDLTGIPHPLILFNVEWVTARYIHLLVTDIHWTDDHPSGTIGDLVIGGKVAFPDDRSELRGRVTLGLSEKSSFDARRLCDVLEVVEFMQPLQRVDALLPRDARVSVADGREPIQVFRSGAPVMEITAIARDRRFSRATHAGLMATAIPIYGPAERGEPRRVSVADRYKVDRWALERIADALETRFGP